MSNYCFFQFFLLIHKDIQRKRRYINGSKLSITIDNLEYTFGIKMLVKDLCLIILWNITK